MDKLIIIDILSELRELSLQHGNGIYGELGTALRDIDSILSSHDLLNESHHIRHLVLPTSNLQELSIDCGWGDRFLTLAKELERNI